MDFFNILFNQRYEGHRGDLIEQLFAAASGGGSATSFSGTPPFMLLNAVAKAIKKLVQFGKVEQADTPTPSAPVDLMLNNGKFKTVDSELPLGYNRLTGISFDGNSWYDTNEYLYGSDVVTMKLASTSTSGQNVFGAYSGTTEGKKNFSFYAYGSTTGGSYLRYGETLYRPKLGTGERTITFGAGGTSGFYENVSFSEEQFTTTDKALIGALPSSTSPKYTGSIIGDILVGTRLRFIPCERESDGAIGYYEVSKGVFLENEGRGTPVSLGYDTTHLTPRVVGEPEVISLALITGEETVSGSIASFVDGADGVPMSSVKASINPIQDLHGQSSPYPAGGGKNIMPNIGENATYSTLGITVSYDADEEVYTINGTSLMPGNILLAKPTSLDWIIGSRYYLSCRVVSGSMTLGEGTGITYALALFSEDNATFIRGGINETAQGLDGYNGYENAFNGGSFYQLFLQCWRTGTVFNNLKIKVQIERNDTQATAWSPYVNICPISGRTEVNVNHSGEDMTDYVTITTDLGQTVYGGTLEVVSGVLTVTEGRKVFDGSEDEGWYSSPYNYYGSATIADAINENTSASNQLCDVFPYGNITNQNQTTGICLIWGYIRVREATIGTLEDWKTYLSNNPMTVVYKLATPTTYQLTPQEVTSLLGGNTVWADSGDVEVTYRKVGTAQTASAENLLSVGDYEDTQDIITGAVTRKVGVKVFDGTEDWVAGSSEGLFRLNLPDKKVEKSLYLSSHFVYSSAASLEITDGQMMCGAASANCYFKNSSTATLSDFTAWLAAQYTAGTPVIVMYPLAREVTESVTPQSLRPVKGDNVITVKANVDDIEFEGEYIAK